MLPAVVVQAVRGDQISATVAAGRMNPYDANSLPVTATTPFLTASLTKPFIALGILTLVEQGRLSLNDRLCDLSGDVTDPAKKPITIRHLLTHTSGLPDLPPNNRELRQSHSNLAEFVSAAKSSPLEFAPGYGVQYSSLGFAWLGDLIEKLSEQPCAEYLDRLFFRPLGMNSTTLGMPDHFGKTIAQIRVPPEQVSGDDWNWNSTYWRKFGAPWGGLISTAGDLMRMSRMLLNGGVLEGVRVLSSATIAASFENQLHHFPNIPEADRRTRGWGLGWRRQWPAHSACFGDLVSPATVGHWGATGCLWWIDPERHSAAVFLTTQPLERDRSPVNLLSNAVVAAM